MNRHSSNCHVLGLSWLVLGEFGAIPTLALLHDGLCTFDLSWISTVPRTDGTRTHSASRFHGARETSRKNRQVYEQNEASKAYDLRTADSCEVEMTWEQIMHHHCFKVFFLDLKVIYARSFAYQSQSEANVRCQEHDVCC